MASPGAPARRGSGAEVTDSRIAASRILDDVAGGMLLDAAMDRHGNGLEPRDRRWLQQLVYGTLRNRGWLDAIIEQRVTGGVQRLDRPLLDLLRLGAYQLLRMGGVPAYAAIAQTVELAKRHGIGASKLVNAVLRRLDRERDALAPDYGSDPVDALALEYSHPRWLVARWLARWGEASTRDLLQANNEEANSYLRPWNISGEQLLAELHGAGLETAPAPLLEDSVQLLGAAALTESRAYRRGWCFVQDPAATLVTRYACIPAGSTVADLCAAPGGKTLELARDAQALFAGDRQWSRLQRLRENLARTRADNVHVFAADSRHPPLRSVDAVLLDAPCTGTGTFRRHPDARWRIKVSDIAVLAALQRALIRSAAELVRPGGLLIYATCSLESEENDAQVESFLAERAEWVLEPPAVGTVPDSALDAGRLRVLPQRHGVDGAFAARLRRRG